MRAAAPVLPRRYVRTVFRATPNSRAISRIDLPSAANPCILLTDPLLNMSVLLHLPTETRMTLYEGWVNFLGVPGLILRRRVHLHAA